jgi:hypothetical protein
VCFAVAERTQMDENDSIEDLKLQWREPGIQFPLRIYAIIVLTVSIDMNEEYQRT